ncbi:unnamed protein product, partial [Acidithrix sp. C25]
VGGFGAQSAPDLIEVSDSETCRVFGFCGKLPKSLTAVPVFWNLWAL